MLEIACGTGIVTRHLRPALPAAATLVATDLNEAMVAYARAVVPGGRGCVWQIADAQALPFANESFDVVVCQFGIMFLPEPARGFGEAHRVLAPERHAARKRLRSHSTRTRLTRAMQNALVAMFPDSPPAVPRHALRLPRPGAHREQTRPREASPMSDSRTVRVQSTASCAVEFAKGFARGARHSRTNSRLRGADLDEGRRATSHEAVALVGRLRSRSRSISPRR